MDYWMKEVAKRFGLKINRIFPLRAINMIESNDGFYCFKKVNYKEDKLLFLYEAKEHLANNGFPYTDRYRLAGHRPYVAFKGNLYIMTRWIEGRECDFHNPLEVKKSAITLARLHEASKGYVTSQGGKGKSDLGKWTKIYLKRCDDLLYMKNLVKMKSIKNEIDTLFLRNVDRCYHMGINAVQMLQSNGYFEQVEEEKKDHYFCHHDYTYHNLILDPEGNQHVIDFDYCKYELRCYDIAHFIMRNMNRFYWDFDMAVELLESYSQKREITGRELKLMVSLFQFPQRFWRVSTRYYYEKYNWTEEAFLKNLSETVDNMPFQIDFLEKYYKKFL